MLTVFAFLGGFGGGEMVLILIVVLILFGGERMPELARSLGKTLREIKKATSGVENEIKRALEEPTLPSRYAIKPGNSEIPTQPPAPITPPMQEPPPEKPPRV